MANRGVAAVALLVWIIGFQGSAPATANNQQNHHYHFYESSSLHQEQDKLNAMKRQTQKQPIIPRSVLDTLLDSNYISKASVSSH
jgi:hypothetical protein